MPHRVDGPVRIGRTVLLAAALAYAGTAPVNATGSPASIQSPPEVAARAAVSGEPEVPEPSPGSLDVALRLIREGRPVDAREILEPLVSGHPNSTRALLLLALTYHGESHWEPARKLFERVLELDPGIDEARVPYGWCLYYLGDLDRARESFEAYLKIRPDYLDAVFALGLIDFDDDNVESARVRFARAIGLARRQGDRPREALARSRMADVLTRSGELDEARGELLRSIKLDPGNAKSYFKLSRVLQRLGDEEGAAKARKQYEDAIARNPPRGEMR